MKRNGLALVADRWTKTVRDGEGNTKRVPSAEHGRGLRWRARYIDDHGKEHSKAFGRKADAQTWLDNEITPALANGTYVAPQAGRVTVAVVYASWSASQGHISAKTAATRRSTWGSRVEPHWGDVALVDVKTSAVRAWVAKMAAEEVGAATIGTPSACCVRCWGRPSRTRASPAIHATGCDCRNASTPTAAT